MPFNDWLGKICDDKNSHVCVGLDVDIDKIPEFLRQSDDPLFEFSKAIIDTTEEFAAAFKINTAFFEAYGVYGWQALAKIVKYLPDSVLKIADAKRGDIGNTSRMYAKAFFKELSFDAMTINPYLGFDGIAPFIENGEKGVFILCVTSNDGAQDFQKVSDGKRFLFENVAIKALQWNDKNNCGLVVGATHPTELKRVRDLTPGLPFLVPGVGKQGGDLVLAVKYTLGNPTDGAIFNSSRGIIYASSGKDFAEIAAQKTSELKNSINNLKAF
jgi:orotidine-5'-phosphate decarboxylase